MQHTENCPKPMLPVGGKAIQEHIIERARGEGFDRFALALDHLGSIIEGIWGWAKKNARIIRKCISQRARQARMGTGARVTESCVSCSRFHSHAGQRTFL